MRENEINGLIGDFLREAPTAPDELRHNVMAAINELELAPRQKKGNIFKTATALAGIAVFAVVIIAVGTRFNKNDVAPMANNMFYMTGGTASMDAAVSEEANEDVGGIEENDNSGVSVMPGSGEDPEVEEAISAAKQFSKITYSITGELPEELESLEYTEEPDGSRVYVNVPDEIILLLFVNDSEVDGESDITSDTAKGTQNIIKWSP